MFNLEDLINNHVHGIELMKEEIEKDPNFPFKTPYTLAKEVGTEMSLNFRIKDRDKAQAFLSSMMYSDDEEELKLKDLLGIEVYQINLQPYNHTYANYEDILRHKLHDFCKFCVETGLYNP